MDRDLQIELNRRDRQRLSEELAELENEVASCWNRIFWNVLSLLIVEPAIVAATAYYFWGKITDIANTVGLQNIANWKEFFSTIKWVAIGFAISFTLTSLSLLWYLWKVASLKKQIAKTKIKISRLER